MSFHRGLAADSMSWKEFRSIMCPYLQRTRYNKRLFGYSKAFEVKNPHVMSRGVLKSPLVYVLDPRYEKQLCDGDHRRSA